MSLVHPNISHYSKKTYSRPNRTRESKDDLDPKSTTSKRFPMQKVSIL